MWTRYMLCKYIAFVVFFFNDTATTEIYTLSLHDALPILLDKVKKEIITGQIEAKQVFKISKVGTVAGGLFTGGKVHSKDKARVVRYGMVKRNADIVALQRFQDDATEVATGLVCAISLANLNDFP